MFLGFIGTPEILLILVVALLLFGADRLPSIARSLGRAFDEFRRAANDLTREVLTDTPPPPKSLPPQEPPPSTLPPGQSSPKASGNAAKPSEETPG